MHQAKSIFFTAKYYKMQRTLLTLRFVAFRSKNHAFEVNERGGDVIVCLEIVIYFILMQCYCENMIVKIVN